MKSFILLLFLLFTLPQVAFSEETKIECKTERRWLGVYWQECPRGAVATGARARLVGNFIYTDVECEDREVVCEVVKEKDESDTEL